MLFTARLGDHLSHGATIISGSSTRTVDGIPVARLGDLVNCPIHGVNPIIAVLDTPLTDGVNTAHLNAAAACGAIIIDGSTDVLIDV